MGRVNRAAPFSGVQRVAVKAAAIEGENFGDDLGRRRGIARDRHSERVEGFSRQSEETNDWRRRAKAHRKRVFHRCGQERGIPQCFARLCNDGVEIRGVRIGFRKCRIVHFERRGPQVLPIAATQPTVRVAGGQIERDRQIRAKNFAQCVACGGHEGGAPCVGFFAAAPRNEAREVFGADAQMPLFTDVQRAQKFDHAEVEFVTRNRPADDGMHGREFGHFANTCGHHESHMRPKVLAVLH